MYCPFFHLSKVKVLQYFISLVEIFKKKSMADSREPPPIEDQEKETENSDELFTSTVQVNIYDDDFLLCLGTV